LTDDRRHEERRCYDCSGYKARLDDHEKELHHLTRGLNGKLGTWWLVLMIPLLIVWLGFQGEMYDGVKNIQKDIAVIQTTLRIEKGIK